MKMNMKKFLKKLRINPNQREDGEGSVSNRSNKSSDAEPSPSDSSRSQESKNNPEFKPFAGFSNWLSSVAQRRSSSTTASSNANNSSTGDEASLERGAPVVSESVMKDLGSGTSKDPEVEEEYQIQLALELSAREDPEAAQIEAIKQFSLGSCPPAPAPAPENSPAELMAYRYWVRILTHCHN